MREKKSWPVKILIGIAALLLIAVAGFFIFVSTSYEAIPSAKKSLQSDDQLIVKEEGNILFEPVSEARDIGFIFYPGAKVEAPAYAKMAKEIAAKGYPVLLADLPFNLAILSPDRADEIISDHPEIKRWVIGGHSLGGVMAADYALEHEEIEGLVLLASYPQSKTDLSDSSLKVLSLWGSNDKVADLEKVKGAKSMMPSDAEFIGIEGGNHGGFGEYGHQKGDGETSLSGDQQIQDTVKYVVEFLGKLNE
ncbi:alpha/beta family hydrolase [Sporosarcina gallistercoris]|uniref:Alpha/beta hydrolase n=1 Tax=Sporosarcina gallistercoris TaxID=2762245 RepID=A0ABR8PI32_9BACL|nr:alpha/beta family hydrolase [Sporosarcina gallistercoris]MBD7907734.1 alpha/beta hydrolase [Sporosarcina gallistercoris]